MWGSTVRWGLREVSRDVGGVVNKCGGGVGELGSGGWGRGSWGGEVRVRKVGVEGLG